MKRAVDVAADACLQIDVTRPRRSRSTGCAGLRVERQHPSLAHARDRRGGVFASPGQYATPRLLTGPPDSNFQIGLPVSGSSAKTVEPRRDVHQAVDDERRDLKVAAAGVERPRLLQLGDVLPGDLRQRRESLRARIAAEGPPVALARDCGAAPMIDAAMRTRMTSVGFSMFFVRSPGVSVA